MKKSKLLAVCLIGVLMAVGLVIMGCGSKCPRNGDCKYTSTGYSTIKTSCTDAKCVIYKSTDYTSAACDCK